jgi:hypothetical protein
VTRSRLAWLLSLGLLIGGWVAAHGLAYRIAVPDGAERRHLLEATGHSYLDPAPLLSLCMTLVALGLIGSLLSGRASALRRHPPAWLVAALPVIGFGLQEHLERFLHDGHAPYAAALEPTFAVGLLLQLPFALAALLLARALLILTGAFVRRLRRESLARMIRLPGVRGPVPTAVLPRVGLLALGHGQRAPPQFVLR